MPSSYRPRTRLETAIALCVLGAVALGTVVLLRRPQLWLAWLQRQSPWPIPWATAVEHNNNQAPGHLPLPLVGANSKREKPSAINVPPPVIPPTLSPVTQTPQPKAASLDRPIVLFSDLSTTHWAYPIVSALAERNLVTGFPDGSFRPERSMTRAEFAAQLSRVFNLSPMQDAQLFHDVNAEHWATQDIQKAIQMEFLTGYPDQTFKPEQTISRIQVLTALANGLHLKSSSGSDPALSYYQDSEQIPDWAIRPLVAATEAGLVVNYPDLTQLNPNDQAQRVEVMTMIYRALVYMGHVEDLPSPYWVIPEPLPY
jgi:hypothetical protein